MLGDDGGRVRWVVFVCACGGDGAGWAGWSGWVVNGWVGDGHVCLPRAWALDAFDTVLLNIYVCMCW